MSNVTSVAIIVNQEYGMKEVPKIDTLNNWLKERYSQFPYMQLFQPLNYQQSAGTKTEEHRLYSGGFNYLNIKEFIELFQSLKWEDAVLVIKTEQERSIVIIQSEDDL